MPDPQDVSQITPPVEIHRRPLLRFFAALISMLVPGSGHLFLNDRRRAVGFFLAFIVLVVLYWPVRLPLHYWGFVAALASGLGLLISVSCSAVRFVSPKALPASRWWFLITVPLALVFAFGLDMNAGLRMAGFRVFTVPSSSMEATIEQDDTLIADMLYFQRHPPRDGDVMIFRHNGLFLIKRIIAMSGERVSSEAGTVAVNGIKIEEPYAHHSGDAPPEVNNFGPITVPAGQLFVMGDNRDVSLDSRIPNEFGVVTLNDVAGVPLYIIRSKHDRIGSRIH